MTTMAISETGTRRAIDLGSVFRHGWRLFIDDVVHLLIATVVATLLSEDGRWINGQVWHVNGGALMP